MRRPKRSTALPSLKRALPSPNMNGALCQVLFRRAKGRAEPHGHHEREGPHDCCRRLRRHLRAVSRRQVESLQLVVQIVQGRLEQPANDAGLRRRVLAVAVGGRRRQQQPLTSRRGERRRAHEERRTRLELVRLLQRFELRALLKRLPRGACVGAARLGDHERAPVQVGNDDVHPAGLWIERRADRVRHGAELRDVPGFVEVLHHVRRPRERAGEAEPQVAFERRLGDQIRRRGQRDIGFRAHHGEGLRRARDGVATFEELKKQLGAHPRHHGRPRLHNLQDELGTDGGDERRLSREDVHPVLTGRETFRFALDHGRLGRCDVRCRGGFAGRGRGTHAGGCAGGVGGGACFGFLLLCVAAPPPPRRLRR
mmetsp:Transcript_52286/g.161012  ORF Transcript_52286/g.161012 Transcript_52286/m.161012 type:complete len:369 (-) Transcript_52286:122-1228(-)